MIFAAGTFDVHVLLIPTRAVPPFADTGQGFGLPVAMVTHQSLVAATALLPGSRFTRGAFAFRLAADFFVYWDFRAPRLLRSLCVHD